MYKSGRCDPREVAIFFNKLLSPGLEPEFNCNSHEPDCRIGRFYAEPIALGDAENSTPKRLTDWVQFKTVAYPELDFSWWLNTIHGPENLLLESIVSFRLRTDNNVFDIGALKEELDFKVIWKHGVTDQIDPQHKKKPGRTQTIKNHYGATPFLTSNGCWLVVPRTERYRSNIDSTINTQILKLRQNLYVYSLDENRDGKICKYPAYRVAGAENEIPKRTRKHLFHTKIRPAIENTTTLGVDYSAFSPLELPEQLHMVYQRGFPSDSCYPKESCVENEPNEKGLSGDLIYRVFRRDDTADIKVNMESAINLTRNCDFGGWEYKPTFSRDKERLFFLAMDDSGDDKSINNLYVADVGLIKSAIDGELDNVLEVSSGGNIEKIFPCMTHISNLTSAENIEFDYPIIDYSSSPDSKRLQITFEEHGESVVRFFKYNKKTNSIVYQYPESIKGIGKIYDLTHAGYLDNNNDNPIFYVLHSYHNFPVSISRCYLSVSRFVCGSRSSPIRTTKIGMELLGSTDISKTRNRSDKVSITRTKVPVSGSSYPIDTFILHPTNNNGKAIVSVHGGPYEAWDGRFSPRDHRLSQLGYTVYLPNPSGSTGYGYQFTNRGDDGWGTTIFNDIKSVVKHVRDSQLFDGVYLMGFSFGGYMVNRIQTHSDSSVRDDLDAMIAISPVFDLKEFASSTDQLWFPQFHLGCSFPESRRDPDCERGSDKSMCRNYPGADCNKIRTTDSEISPIMAHQNPADGKERLTSESPPTLFIIGDADQRIPFFYNVPPLLRAYRSQCAPHTLQAEEFLGHDFPSHRAREQGDSIHRWIQDIKTCANNHPDRMEFLACEYEEIILDDCIGLQPDQDGKYRQCEPVHDHNPFIQQRTGTFVFDNAVEGYLQGSLLYGLELPGCEQFDLSPTT